MLRCPHGEDNPNPTQMIWAALLFLLMARPVLAWLIWLPVKAAKPLRLSTHEYDQR